MNALLAVVWLHFLGDFVFQSDSMARNKSKSNAWLLCHTSMYTMFLVPLGWKFALVNGAAHTVVDWFSSRATSRLWAAKEVHWFFVVIGLDQALHLTILLLTLGVR